MKQDLTTPEMTRDGYPSFVDFARRHPSLTYAQLDGLILSEIDLFTPAGSCDFDALEQACGKILSALPAIKRIFAAPITRLKDTTDIMPVEAVRVVNNRTVIHAMSHSQLWADITEDGPRPRKLMTLDYRDDYAIYENIAFVHAVRNILRFTTKNIRLLRDMLFLDRDLSFNLLDRRNHASYFLALGKLRAGYMRNYDRYRVAAKRQLETLLFIDRVVRAGMHTPLWRQCAKLSDKIKLKKTNVFRLHKDYHRIYGLLKWLDETDLDGVSPDWIPAGDSREGYGIFCTLLTVFAAGHFNFTFDDTPMDVLRPDVVGHFEGWRLHIDAVAAGDVAALRLTVSKDVEYTVVLVPAFDEGDIADFRHVPADEYQAITPCESSSGVYLSRFDLDSFRRIQQILLRAMICADTTRDMCPFCGRPLAPMAGGYECEACSISY